MTSPSTVSNSISGSAAAPMAAPMVDSLASSLPSSLPGTSAGAEVSAGLAQWLSQGGEAAIALPNAAVGAAVEEQRFLRFSLQGHESALLPLSSIQEVLQVPKRGLLRVPGMPGSILGVSNCRGSVLWMVDLALLLGLETAPTGALAQPWQALSRVQQSLNTITIQAAGESLGLVVPKVMDIETHASQQIQPPSADLFTAQLLPFLAGYLARSCSPVFSASALIEHLQLQRPSR